jgi:hypothetical protein
MVEIVWGVLFPVGIKKVNTVAESTKHNDPHLTYLPYSHGLAANIFWAVLSYIVFRQEK